MRAARVPEVIQTSAMDCGPAALAALAQGFGLPVAVGRLREVCQTQVDGTSLDRLGGVARQLGLDARQILLPREAVCRAAGEALPSLLLTRQPDGRLHFVVGWRLVGGAVEIMDPAEGRRSLSAVDLEGMLHEATFSMPAAAWRAWALGPVGLGLVSAWMDQLGLPLETQEALADRGFSASWREAAALHAALRLGLRLHAEGLPAGPLAAAAVERLFELAMEEIAAGGEPRLLPASCWPAWPGAEPDEARVSGVPLVVVRGLLPEGPALEGELAGLLAPPSRSALSLLRGALAEADPRWAPRVGLGLLALAGGGLLELLLLRGLVDVVSLSGAPLGRLGLGLAALALLGGLLALRAGVGGLALRLGRQVELRLRVALLHRLPRLPDRYLRSRPASDLAERAHALHLLRGLPQVGLDLGRGLVELVLTIGLLAGMAPWTLPVSLLLVGALAVATRRATRSMGDEARRVGAAHGALARVGLDALLGAVALRAHGSTAAIEAEQEGVLVELGKATRALRDRGLAVGARSGGLSVAGVAAILGVGAAQGAGNLLFVLFALRLPAIVSGLAGQGLSLPGQMVLLARLLEALETPAEAGADAQGQLAPGPIALSLRGLVVEAAGQRLLKVPALDVAPGEQIAIVGRSGAGKSTLLGLLLGWHRPAAGQLWVNGQPLDPAARAALRQRTAWVDPAQMIWSGSLLDNLRYGADDPDLGPIIEVAQLRELLGRCPEGLASEVGEGGAGLSGGEGQRLRIGRALGRRNPDLVLLDEPCRGLDRSSRGALMEALRRRWPGATLLAVSHDLRETLQFPRVLVVEGGQIVQDGPPAALAAVEGPFADLLAAEEALARAAWGDPAWIRWRVAEGRLWT